MCIRDRFDGNGDGKGDNANKLSFIDDVQAEPMPFIGIGLVIALLVGLVVRTAGGRGEEFDEFEDYDETDEFIEEDDEEYEEEIDA